MSQSLLQRCSSQLLANVLVATAPPHLQTTRHSSAICHDLPHIPEHSTDDTYRLLTLFYHAAGACLLIPLCHDLFAMTLQTPDLPGQNQFSPKVLTFQTAQEQCSIHMYTSNDKEMPTMRSQSLAVTHAHPRGCMHPPPVTTISLANKLPKRKCKTSILANARAWWLCVYHVSCTICSHKAIKPPWQQKQSSPKMPSISRSSSRPRAVAAHAARLTLPG